MTPHPTAVVEVTTTGGFLLVLSIVVPLAGALLAFAAGGRNLERVALATLPVGLAIAVAIAFAMPSTGAPLVYLLGGWAPPLGVALRADGLSAGDLRIAAIVICWVGGVVHDAVHTPPAA